MMSSSAASLHNQRAEAEHSQRVPDVDSAQQIKLKERQRFFEEVFQHDVDHLYHSSSHLTIRDYRRPPIGSISSMEVNVDMLEQMELFDIPDHESLDVFFSSGAEEGMASPVPAQGNNNNNNEEVMGNGLLRHVLEGWDAKYRMSSTSSNSSSNSDNTNMEGEDTPVIQSDEDEEEAHTSSTGLHIASSMAREKGKQSLSSS